jgi:hypothetical protein
MPFFCDVTFKNELDFVTYITDFSILAKAPLSAFLRGLSMLYQVIQG